MFDQKLYDRCATRSEAIPVTNCWEWTGPRKRGGHPGNRYGMTSIYRDGKQRSMATHRAIMWAIHGPMTKEQVVCHKCDNVLCINPAHLWIGTMKENIWDSRNKGRHFEAAKTHCDKGHPLSGDNLRITKQCKTRGKTGFRRQCKICTLVRLRVNAGWPEELAIKTPPLKFGYVMNFETGIPYAPGPKRRAALKKQKT